MDETFVIHAETSKAVIFANRDQLQPRLIRQRYVKRIAKFMTAQWRAADTRIVDRITIG